MTESVALCERGGFEQTKRTTHGSATVIIYKPYSKWKMDSYLNCKYSNHVILYLCVQQRIVPLHALFKIQDLVPKLTRQEKVTSYIHR